LKKKNLGVPKDGRGEENLYLDPENAIVNKVTRFHKHNIACMFRPED
jgi:hypothetical protein